MLNEIEEHRQLFKADRMKRQEDKNEEKSISHNRGIFLEKGSSERSLNIKENHIEQSWTQIITVQLTIWMVALVVGLIVCGKVKIF